MKKILKYKIKLQTDIFFYEIIYDYSHLNICDKIIDKEIIENEIYRLKKREQFF